MVATTPTASGATRRPAAAARSTCATGASAATGTATWTRRAATAATWTVVAATATGASAATARGCCRTRRTGRWRNGLARRREWLGTTGRRWNRLPRRPDGTASSRCIGRHVGRNRRRRLGRRRSVGARTSTGDDAARLGRRRRRSGGRGLRRASHLRNRTSLGGCHHGISSGGLTLDGSCGCGTDRRFTGRGRRLLFWVLRIRSRFRCRRGGRLGRRCGGRCRLDGGSVSRTIRNRLGCGLGWSFGRNVVDVNSRGSLLRRDLGCRFLRGGLLLSGRSLRGSLLLCGGLLLGRLLLRLRLFGLLVTRETFTLGASTQHVGVRLLQGRRGRLGSNARGFRQVEQLTIGHPEFFRELVDTDLLRRHVSIQPFPVVIPSPMIGSVGVFFVRSKRGTNGLDVVLIECAPPRTSELVARDRLIEALRNDQVAIGFPTQPRATTATRSADRDGRTSIADRPRDPNEFGLRTALATTETAADGKPPPVKGRSVLINRWNPPWCSRPPQRTRRCRTRFRRSSGRRTNRRARGTSSSPHCP